jgi:hypothetical protein
VRRSQNVIALYTDMANAYVRVLFLAYVFARSNHESLRVWSGRLKGSIARVVELTFGVGERTWTDQLSARWSAFVHG